MARKRRKAAKKWKPFPKPIIKKKFLYFATNLIFRLLPAILLVALVGAGLKVALSFLLNSDYFKVKRIDNKIESSLSSPVAMELSSKKGLNIFSIDLRECESNIRAGHPEFKDVRVGKVLPDGLWFSYEIRKPFCQADSGYFYLVSDDMVVFPNPLVAAEPNLPVITGVDISERALGPDRRSQSKALKKAISLLKEIEASSFSKRHKAVKINIYEPRSPSIYIEDGTRIEIGEYSFKEREGVLKEVLDDLESKNKKAKIIDLRFEDVVVIPR